MSDVKESDGSAAVACAAVLPRCEDDGSAVKTTFQGMFSAYVGHDWSYLAAQTVQEWSACHHTSIWLPTMDRRRSSSPRTRVVFTPDQFGFRTQTSRQTSLRCIRKAPRKAYLAIRRLSPGFVGKENLILFLGWRSMINEQLILHIQLTTAVTVLACAVLPE